MSAGRGIPLLSGPPPPVSEGSNETACRKCNKEFNLIFVRSRRCNHCGYLYCHSCTDYQALMPRRVQAIGGVQQGHDPVPVCAYCIEDLTITASGKGHLRSMPLAKLKKYANDYNIDMTNVIERDELINRLIAARGSNGCLPKANENYYRQHSVPRRATEPPRGLFSRARGAMSQNQSPNTNPARPQQPPYQPRARTTSHPEFPRPDLDSPQQQEDRQPRPQQRQPPRYQYQNYNPYVSGQSGRPNFTNPYSSDVPSRTQPQAAPRPAQNNQNQSNLNVPPVNNARPRAASAPRTPTRTTSPLPTIPTLDELLSMTSEDIRVLSISTLKTVLFQNHVPTSMVVEKSELVAKVVGLVADEKAEREAAARRALEEEREDREMREAIERSNREEEDRQTRERDRQQSETLSSEGEGEVGTNTPSPTPHTPNQTTSSSTSPERTPPPGNMTPKAQALASHLERTGLCVICQDEEANIAIVDCGHLAMCRSCADLIMSNTRECPLCRTRIVTEARLLRIFKS